MFYPNKAIYHWGTFIVACLISASYMAGYSIGYRIMQHHYQDIMSSKLPVPSPIYAFKG